MKIILVAVASAVILGAGAMVVLERVQKPAETAFSTSGVRL